MRGWPRNFLAISDMNRRMTISPVLLLSFCSKNRSTPTCSGTCPGKYRIAPQLSPLRKPGGYSLIVNPEYFDQVLSTREQRVAAIKHEALHFVFSHVFRAEKFAHQEIYNLAADLVVNQYLEPWLSLPDAFTLELLGEVGVWMNRDESVEYYYEELLKILEQNEGGDGDDGRMLQESISTTNQRGDHQF